MKPWMRVAAGVGVVVVAGCAGLYGYGSTLPETHTATVEVHVDGSPAEVEARVRDWRAAASWKRDVQSVEALPEVAGRARFRECTWECLDLEILPTETSGTYLTRIVDHPDFGGTWTWRFTPDGAGTRVVLTEDGVVPSPVFRLFMQHVFGEDANIRGTAEALRASYGGP
ncbi:MAG: SRPBCC family protein [Alphaproteobacteria bacterium]|nr:SRPBCC family protein [Alphaproteobacteria bacterium]